MYQDVPAPSGKLTCFTYKDLLGGTGGSLTHCVVHTHANLVAPVLAQVCGERGDG